MKKLIFAVFFVFLCTSLLEAQANTTTEVLFKNYTQNLVKVQCFPISMVMNERGHYNIIARHRRNMNDIMFDYNNGLYYGGNLLHTAVYLPTYSDNQEDPNANLFGWNNDYTAGEGMAIGSVGPGIYKFTFNVYDSIIIENDGDETRDITISYRSDGVYYKINDDQGYEVKVDYELPETYHVKLWDPYPTNPNYTYHREKSLMYNYEEYYYKNFVYDEGDIYANNPYSVIPIDSRMDCNGQPFNHPNQNHYFPDSSLINTIEERQGILTLNLDIYKDVHTPTAFYSTNDPNHVYNPNHVVPVIKIIDGAGLKIKSSTSGPRTFTMNQYTGHSKGGEIEVDAGSNLYLENAYSNSYNNRVELIMNAYCHATIKQNGWLMHGNQSIIYVKDYSQLTLKNGSYYSSGNYKNSSILVYPYGIFCNEGAIIGGRLNVRYVGGIHYVQCDGVGSDIYINDSTQYVLSDSAALIIPDNKTVHFQGSETLLQMDSNTAIKFGQNSKIVFENGARISAKHSKFIPLTSNATWSGIYLSDLSKDTLKNCVIENAVNGITIEDKIRVSEISDDVSTVITGCSIINSTTSTQLVNGIYAFNSSDILLKDNTISSSQTNGFSIGMWLEYCSPVNVNIIGNTIGNSVNGINLLHSSPFISRNAITGQTGSTYGMYLDNSNSAIKNNTVSNFNYSLVASYSSPGLYSNTFSNASQVFLDLKKNSVPIMSPVNSGSTLYWYGGRNSLSGNPSAAAIYISEESYPSMNEGYNTVNSGINDYIEGDIPSSLQYGILYATNNYWNNSSFDPLYFNVSNGSVEYDPLFDGSSYPSFDTYSLIDIGFGLYDTVFAKILGDNAMSSLFMEAVNYEYAKNYSAAIGKYKDVISAYKESEYAALSVSRIFDCLQKMGGDVSRYTSNNTYLNGLKNNNQYPIIIRELAEDFIIKGKAKSGSLTEAISDYESIYQQNLNTQKGLHALINKECLTAFIADTLGDSQGSSFNDRTEHKNTLLNVMKLRTGNQSVQTQNSLVPDKYSLEQNYPNPFNPVTKIAYNIPKESRVTLVVYDMLGREIAKLVNNETKKAGTYIVEFNAFNFASGVYFYRIKANDFVQTKRMVLVK